jgi:pyruvate,orthophosphate dikinase
MKNNGIFRIAPLLSGPLKGDADAMGAKAFDLSRLSRLGLSVPPAFVLGTAHCRRWQREPERYMKNLAALLDEQMRWLQSITGLGFGDPRKPLLVSVRSGAPVSMPGMMDTLLNIGLCDSAAHGLLRMTGNPRLVWDSYRRLIQNYAEVVCKTDPLPFALALDQLLAREQLERPQELDYQSLAELTRTYLTLFNELTGRAFPQNPLDQLQAAVLAVFASWNSDRAREYRRLHGLADHLCTGVTIQRMVFGNAGGMSGAGVGFTRDPDTGDNRLYFDFLFNSQGEDLVSGRITGSDGERLFLTLPEMRQELDSVCSMLEQEFRDAQEFEFTIQEGRLYLLQARSAKRTGWAALRIAVEQVGEGLIERSTALARLDRLDLGGLKRQRLSLEDKHPLCQGQAAGIGVATGPLALDAESVARFKAEVGRPALLVRNELSTADIAAISESAGVLTARGNRTSHAAVVARQLGKPCVTGCSGLRIDLGRRVVDFGERSLPEGAMLTLDSNTGRVYAGLGKIETDYPTVWLDQIRTWR